MQKLNFIIIFALTFLFFVGCDTVKDEEPLINDNNPPDSSGYRTATAAGVTLKYKKVNENLNCILSAQTEGWVSVGFNSSQAMKDANIIMGYVDNSGNALVRDDWGSSQYSHESDENLGGTDDVTLIQGSQIGGKTEIEFEIHLNSGDSYDRVLLNGETYPIILARGNSDNFDSQHSDRGYSSVTISDAPLVLQTQTPTIQRL